MLKSASFDCIIHSKQNKPLLGDVDNCYANIYYTNISIQYKNAFDECNLDNNCIAFYGLQEFYHNISS